MKAFFKSIPKFVLWLVPLIILILILGLITWRPLRVLNLQSRAGQMIEDYIEANASAYSNYFTCQLPVLTQLPPDTRLEEAVAQLEKAHSLRPQNTHTHYQLGRAYCLTGDFFAAIDSFKAFNDARPTNPLGRLEKAFAHTTLVLTDEKLPDHQIRLHEAHSRRILHNLGLAGDYFLEQANAAFRRSDYRVAWFWYRLAHTFQPLEEADAFRTMALDLAFSKQTFLTVNMEEALIKPMEDSLVIPPEAFVWLDNGSPIRSGEEEGGTSAILRTNREKGIAFLGVDTGGRYCLSVEALDRAPQPTRIELTLDLERVALMELPNGDDVWRTFKLDMTLEEGVSLLGVRLTNPDTVNDLARYGYVGAMTLTPCDD